MNLVYLGATLRACRALRDKTLTDVALGVSLGPVKVTASALSAIENGVSPGPRIEVVWAVLDYLTIDPDLRWALICAVASDSDAVLP